MCLISFCLPQTDTRFVLKHQWNFKLFKHSFLKPTQDLYLNKSAAGLGAWVSLLKPTQDLYLNDIKLRNELITSTLKPTQDLYLNRDRICKE